MRSLLQWLMLVSFFLLPNFALMAQNLPDSKPTSTQFWGNCGDQEEILRGLRTPLETLNQQIRLPWMDTMKRLQIQQAAFRVQFSVQDNHYTFTMGSVTYLRCYYRYDSVLGSMTPQMKSEITELEYALTPTVLKRAVDWVRILQNDPNLRVAAKNKSLTGFCGTLYLNLLDDERLAVRDEPADVELDCRNMKRESYYKSKRKPSNK